MNSMKVMHNDHKCWNCMSRLEKKSITGLNSKDVEDNTEETRSRSQPQTGTMFPQVTFLLLLLCHHRLPLITPALTPVISTKRIPTWCRVHFVYIKSKHYFVLSSTFALQWAKWGSESWSRLHGWGKHSLHLKAGLPGSKAAILLTVPNSLC